MHITRRTATGPASLTVLVSTILVGGCGLGSVSQAQCSGGQQPYKDRCLSQTVIEYLSCTEGRGFSTTNEFNASAGGSFKMVTDASLSVARKKAQQENTPVALEIVKECSELTERSGVAGADRAVLAQFQQEVDDSIAQFEQNALERTPSISLSKTVMHIGSQLTVTGVQFQANETVDIDVDVQTVARVTANSTGSFSATVTIPNNIMVGAPNHQIIAIGRTSARSDRRSVQIQP